MMLGVCTCIYIYLHDIQIDRYGQCVCAKIKKKLKGA